ncbi:type II toxin-antitoxin system Phd/YefM family antitoxin [Rhodopila globiformis]|nr:type II toxin-antitoxin system prevent-host-death family antitoxin [Rhodopila globiformis]
MNIPISDAKAQLTELVRRAEAGEDIVLTRHGQPVMRLVRVRHMPTAAEKRALFADIMQSGRTKIATAGEDAARSQDFLYDDQGLPD